MGSKSDTGYKQKNFFLGFPFYVCLGVYYIMELIIMPFKKLYANTKETVNTTVNKDEELRGAFLKQTEVESKRSSQTINIDVVKRSLEISGSLLKQRDNLISEIDAEGEKRSDKPRTFRYSALSPDGKRETNTFIGFSKVEVYTFLENEGYKVFSIETSPLIERIYGPKTFAYTKIKTKDIVFWLQQLSTYLKSGIPLTDSMRILTKQMGSKNKNIKRIFNSVVYNLTLGESFSTSLEKQGDAFPTLLVNMIRASEATGDLEGTLDDMAEYYKSTETTRKQMVSALTYPSLVLVFAIGVITFIMVYLIPKFVKIYETAGAKLNPFTEFLISASTYIRANIFYILAVIAIFIIINVVLYKNIKAYRYLLQTIGMKLPVIGKVIIYKEMMIFTKTFSSLLKSNVFITDSMDLLSRVTNNEIYREVMARTLNYIARGDKISESFRNHWAVPEVAYYMMVTGESTGELAEMMGKVSDYYAEQHKMLVESLKSLIEPILIILLAVVVGGIIIAIIVPMFGLYSEILV